MQESEAEHHLELAREQLDRCLSAWDPVDWPELAVWGFYCLENAVMAAALALGLEVQRNHPAKQRLSRELHRQGLPDVASLMTQLNEARKSVAYGDITFPPALDPEDVVASLEEYVDAAAAACRGGDQNAD